MTRAAVLALVAALAAAPAAAEPGDVQWYAERHEERRAKLRWCQGDAARTATRECENAEAASAVEYMTPNHPWMHGRTIFPDSGSPLRPRRAAPAPFPEAVPMPPAAVPLPPSSAPAAPEPRKPIRRAT